MPCNFEFSNSDWVRCLIHWSRGAHVTVMYWNGASCDFATTRITWHGRYQFSKSQEKTNRCSVISNLVTLIGLGVTGDPCDFELTETELSAELWLSWLLINGERIPFLWNTLYTHTWSRCVNVPCVCTRIDWDESRPIYKLPLVTKTLTMTYCSIPQIFPLFASLFLLALPSFHTVHFSASFSCWPSIPAVISASIRLAQQYVQFIVNNRRRQSFHYLSDDWHSLQSRTIAVWSRLIRFQFPSLFLPPVVSSCSICSSAELIVSFIDLTNKRQLLTTRGTSAAHQQLPLSLLQLRYCWEWST